MPCENCATQFTIFKRKRACVSCQRLYCSSCLGKRKKSVCFRCEIFLQKPAPTKSDLMDLKTKDLIFYLQSKKINISGIVEKEELANLIINHVNSNSYYESTGTHSSTSTTPNHDFDNYAQSFDQIKQTCANLFTSISDKISTDFQKNPCFNQPNRPSRQPTTQQPRPSTARSNPTSPQTPTQASASNRAAGYSSPRRDSSSAANASVFHSPPSSSIGFPPSSRAPQRDDCDCSDDEIIEISEKRQSIFDGHPGPSGCASNQNKTKITNSSSSDSSSFEELETSAVKLSDDSWQVIEKTASNGIKTVEKPRDALSIDDINMTVASSQPQTTTSSNEMFRSLASEAPVNPDVRKLTRHQSDSSLLSLRKSTSITIDGSLFDPGQSGSEIKRLKISCNRCGKAKSKIKREILKLSDQLKSSNMSEDEANAKIREFLDYLESRSQPSEMTETDNSQVQSNQNDDESGARFIPSSASHDEIEENIFDENEGINVYPTEDHDSLGEASSSTPRRFISLNDIHSSHDLESLSVKQLKEILMLNRVDFKGCCEKQELKERVGRLWQDHLSAPPSEKLPTDDLCKICMDAPIECVFLECGHMAACVGCGKILSECPICRSYIVRVVRIFKS